MFKRIVISASEIENDVLISQKSIEKLKKNIKIKVNEKYLCVIFRNNQVSEVLKMGIYKPFTKQDEKLKNVKIVFVSTEKSKLFPFNSRTTQIKDINSNNICSLAFSGHYSFSVRNERKLLGTHYQANNTLKFSGFADNIQMEVNNIVLSYIIDFFTTTNNSIQEFNSLKNKVEEYVIKLLDKFLDDTYGINVRELKLNDVNISTFCI